MARHWAVRHLGERSYIGALADQVVTRCMRLAFSDLIRRNMRCRQVDNCTVIYNKLGWGWRKDLPPPEGGIAKILAFPTRCKSLHQGSANPCT
jgi:hypothetical protein